MLQRNYFELGHPLTKRLSWSPLDPSIRKTLRSTFRGHIWLHEQSVPVVSPLQAVMLFTYTSVPIATENHQPEGQRRKKKPMYEAKEENQSNFRQSVYLIARALVQV